MTIRDLFDRIEVTPEVIDYVRRSFEISDRIKETLKEKGKTISKLAVALDKTDTEVYHILSGTYHFKPKALKRIEKALAKM